MTPVKKIMTQELIRIRKRSSLQEAYKLMKKNQIRHLPVDDEFGQISGVISLKDLSDLPQVDDIPVEFIMNTAIEFSSENLSLKEAIHKMLRLKVSCLLLTNEKNEASGIITTDDLLAYLAILLLDEKEPIHPVLSAMSLETIGKVADSLATIGI